LAATISMNMHDSKTQQLTCTTLYCDHNLPWTKTSLLSKCCDHHAL